MNVAQAKQIDLPDLLARLGYQEQPVTRQGIWYLSPLRDEKTPSFKVWQLDGGMWWWRDFGKDGLSGNVIAFANCMIGKETNDRAISEALKWLDDVFGGRVAATPVQRTTVPKSGQIDAIKPDRFTLMDEKPLRSPQLINYLEGRGIPRRLSQAYCGQANYYDNVAKKKFFGISFPNIGGGLEIRAATVYKHHVNTGAKTISFIPGQKKDTSLVSVFEGFIDFLSYLVLTGQEKPQDHVIVLNSTSFAAQAANYIISNSVLGETVKSVITYFDNDAAGQKGFDCMYDLLEGKVGDCSYLYKDHDLDDLNEYLTKVPAEERKNFKTAQQKVFNASPLVYAGRPQNQKPS